jgi:hypothetical protein
MKNFVEIEFIAMADIKREQDDGIAVQAVDRSDTESAKDVEQAEEETKSPMRSRKALIAWLILCYSVGNSADDCG